MTKAGAEDCIPSVTPLHIDTQSLDLIHSACSFPSSGKLNHSLQWRAVSSSRIGEHSSCA